MKDGIASTRASCAIARAENLAILGSRQVIELCVGPSLPTLARAYRHLGIGVAGNDIDPKWRFSDAGRGFDWRIGDALKIPLDGFDTAVFAPPLSVGFSGRREDSLPICDVRPSYLDFLSRRDLPKICVLVLPGRSFSTSLDRSYFHALLSEASRRGFEVNYDVLKDERNRVTKYVDMYLTRLRPKMEWRDLR